MELSAVPVRLRVFFHTKVPNEELYCEFNADATDLPLIDEFSLQLRNGDSVPCRIEKPQSFCAMKLGKPIELVRALICFRVTQTLSEDLLKEFVADLGEPLHKRNTVRIN